MLISFSRRCVYIALLLSSLTFAGCLALPVQGPLPTGITLEPVAAKLRAKSPLAVSPDGSMLAIVRGDGLFLLPLQGGLERKISDDLPIALAFNSSGMELAAAFIVVDRSTLRRYGVSQGETLAEISFSGRCESLLHREGEWLVFVSTLKTFRFGGNLRTSLLRWDGAHPPDESMLNDITLDPPTLASGDKIFATMQPQLSPYGDEILYLRLHDPPAFDPYLAVVLRHLETERDHLVTKLPQMSGAATYLDGGESVAYSDGTGTVTLVNPWTEEKIGRIVHSGEGLAASPSGEILWVGESLLHRGGQLLLRFSGEVEPVSFLPEGRLLLREKESLWLLGGLPFGPPVQPGFDAKKLRLLRKWRAEGLIDVQEYTEKVRK